MKQRDPLLDGRKITMGRLHRQEWTVPPLTIGQAQKYTAKLKELTNESLFGLLPLMIEGVTEAMRWNYPDITEEIVANDLLDMSNFIEVFLTAYNPLAMPKQAADGPAPLTGAISIPSMIPLMPGKIDVV